MTNILILTMLLAQDPLDTAPADIDTPSAATAPAEPTPTADEAAVAEGATAPPSDAEGDTEAPEDEEVVEEARPGDSFWDAGAIGYMTKGGIFMWPILIMGVVASGVIIERFRSLKMLRTDSSEFRSNIKDMLAEDRLEDALVHCNQAQGPVPAIMAAGLRKFLLLRRLGYDTAKIEEQVVKAMDDYSVHVVAALERHLPALATVSSAAPMLGFLGTVAGMVQAFAQIQVAKTDIVSAAAAGIEVSLLTTCFGLIIGLPAFIAFNYFTGVINTFVLEVEESATELIETVTLQMALETRE